MKFNDQAYLKLQRHLDRQAVGFPATRSGAEIKILKHIFTPREAELASHLSYRFESFEKIFERVRHLVESPAELEQILERIQKKGGIESKLDHGLKSYCCAPLVVGMYEFQIGRLTPEFVKDFNRYTSDIKFGLEFLSTKLPQMRTIPVSKSISAKHQVSTFDEVTTLLRKAPSPFAIIECICRKKKSIEGKFCSVTDRKETCLAIGSMAQTVLLSGTGRKIARDEAISILQQNQEQGLVLQPSNTELVEFICSCCGCCCGMLRLHQNLPRPLDFWVSNFHAVVNAGICEGCGACEGWCQVGAVSVAGSGSSRKAVVDLNRCLGCGICIINCPAEAISLLKKPAEAVPPKTREDLYETIMSHKKGRLGKMQLAAKMIIDIVRTGHTKLLGR